MISVSTAGAAATLRVQVWRKLRSLGALYLSNRCACCPPGRGGARRAAAGRPDPPSRGHRPRPADDPSDLADEHAVVAELNAARDAEYAEVLEQLPACAGSGRGHRPRPTQVRRGRRVRADLERFRTWLAKIAARDYFVAPAARPPVTPSRMPRPSGRVRRSRAASDAPEPPLWSNAAAAHRGKVVTGTFWWDHVLGVGRALPLAWLALVLALAILRPRAAACARPAGAAPRAAPGAPRRRDRPCPAGPDPPGAAAGLPRAPDRPDPDFIPVLGYADDAIIVTAVLRGVVRRAGVDAVRAQGPEPTTDSPRWPDSPVSPTQQQPR